MSKDRENPVILTSERESSLLSLEFNFEELDSKNAAKAYSAIADILKNPQNISEIIIDLSRIKNFEDLALSLFSTVNILCLEKQIKLSFQGASAKLNTALQKSLEKNVGDLHSSHLSRIRSPVAYIGEVSWQFGQDCKNMLAFIGETAVAISYAATHPRKIRWKETFYYMDVCGADALPIVSLICFLMGLILGFQGAIQLHKFGTDIYLADGVGLSIVKELGPLMVAMICTGRAGSAFAAEIGTMKVAEEIDAMVTMGFVPSRFLIIPKLFAMIIVMPLLTVFGDIAGIFGGMVVGHMNLGLPVITYYNRTLVAIKPIFFTEGLIKSMVFAILITVVGCMRGFESKNDAQGVGRATTSAVVSGIFLIILADTLLTILFSVLW